MIGPFPDKPPMASYGALPRNSSPISRWILTGVKRFPQPSAFDVIVLSNAGKLLKQLKPPRESSLLKQELAGSVEVDCSVHQEPDRYYNDDSAKCTSFGICF
jgi:hypothetical protein